jgi:UDP-N-acetylglucosamine--N-acetylmuramyl-(pentapeptide) pyrophosphoryl-undecaprenol N-acetylglucosamine transferase
MKLLIVAGGGGHFAPSLAVIEKLPKDVEVLLVGRKYALEGDSALSFEYQTAKKLKLQFVSITAGRFQRKFTRHTIGSLLKSPIGLIGAIRAIREYKPDVVLSFGGYVSVPVVIAAAFQKIPIVVHEQVLGAGFPKLRSSVTVFIPERETTKSAFSKMPNTSCGSINFLIL